MAVSYEPLWHTLLSKKLKKQDLYTLDISTATVSKMGKNEYVALQILEKICLGLDCKIDDVVEILPNEE